MKMPATLVAVLGLVGLLCVGAALPFLVLGWITPSAPAIVPVAQARLARFPHGVIRYEDVGQGERALLFLHGFNGQMGAWTGAWERLESCGRRVRLDLPGYGESAWDSRSFTLAEQAGRVVAFLDSLGLHRVTLVGTSMGGSLAAWIAAYYPDRVEQLALLAPSGYPGALRYPGLVGVLLKPGWLNAVATRLARTGFYSRLFPASKALQALTVTSSYGPAWVEALGRIRAPTLITWSVGDFGVSYTSALSVQQAIHGSHLIWLDRTTGHLIPQERPQLVAELSCLLAQGVAPAAVSTRLSPGVLRQGEGQGDAMTRAGRER
jgi:pimeloyl-ACP methyl ester carboxylesterase